MGRAVYLPVMRSSEYEGLGLSLVIYMAAIAGALAVAALPVYLANRPQVYENPPLARANPLLNGPIVGNRVSTGVPLAMLKREIIVDPAIIAALNAKAEKAEKAAAVRHPVRRTAQRSDRTPMAELQSERPRHSFFLFNLFGG